MKRRTLLSAILVLPFAPRLLADCEVKGQKPSGITHFVPKPNMHSLFVLGDYGTGGSLQKKVARTMNARAAGKGKPLAMVSTGDNIYPGGVTSATDSQWDSKFRTIYALDQLEKLSWIAVLGNHDYRGSVNAQVEYSKLNARWIMPATYFVQACPGAETLLTFFCLDTQAILQKREGWQLQLQWLKEQVKKSTSTWKVVVGHHPLRSYGHYQDQRFMLEHIKPILDEYGVAAYLCGHDHDLQIIQHPDDGFTCIVSGGGGGCRSTSWGPYSKTAATGGGFAELLFDATTMVAQIVTADGNECGNILIRNKK